MVDVALGGIPEKFRSSRWQATSVRPNRHMRAVLLMTSAPLPRCLAAPHRLCVVAERDDRAGVAGQLGDEPDLDALRLHSRDERMAS